MFEPFMRDLIFKKYTHLNSKAFMMNSMRMRTKRIRGKRLGSHVGADITDPMNKKK